MVATTVEIARRSRLRAFWGSLDRGQRRSLLMMATVVTGLHVAGFGTLFLLVIPHHYAIGSAGAFTVGIGITAYTLGMRHAFDADHIAAIDNTTRKLMSEGKRPLSTGFWFSLGHSSVVFALALLLSVGIRSLAGPVENDGSGLHGVTGLVGTLVSGTFLYLIAALNVVILVGILKVFRAMKRGTYDEAALEEHLNNRGLMNRYLGRVTRSVTKPSQMYPIGILFGLGFDTATEVTLLVLAGGAAGAGLPWYAILTLPVLFAAGMSLLDSIDGSFMNFAYGWAFSKPVRKVFYNLTITGLSRGDRPRDRDDRAWRPPGGQAQPLGHVLDLVREHRHQPARLRDRRPLRRDLACRARDLASRPDRGALDDASRRPRALA